MTDPISATGIAEALLKWGPEAVSVTAVVITVILFLRRDSLYADRIQRLGDECHRRQAEIQAGYMNSLQLMIAADEKRMTMFMERLNRLDTSMDRLAQAVERVNVTSRA